MVTRIRKTKEEKKAEKELLRKRIKKLQRKIASQSHSLEEIEELLPLKEKLGFTDTEE